MATASPERIQALFGDFSERAKTAFEKSTKLSGEMGEMTKDNVQAVFASTRIAAKGVETLAQEAANAGKKHVENATSTFKSYASVKSPTDLFKLHSDFLKSSFDAVVSDTSKFAESFAKLAGEVAQPISNRYAVAYEKVRAATL